MPSKKSRASRKSNSGSAKSSRLNPSEAMCMKCRVPRKVQNPRVVTIKNGRKMMKGVCDTCGTTLNKFVKN